MSSVPVTIISLFIKQQIPSGQVPVVAFHITYTLLGSSNLYDKTLAFLP
jgi:hypothetical protein